VAEVFTLNVRATHTIMARVTSARQGTRIKRLFFTGHQLLESCIAKDLSEGRKLLATQRKSGMVKGPVYKSPGG
jgi:hypothetical protein